MRRNRLAAVVVGVVCAMLCGSGAWADLNLWVTYQIAGTRAYETGDYREAETLLLAALDEVGADFRRARTLDLLGSAYMALERYEQAEARYRQALELKERVLGRDSREVPVTLNNLADLVYLLGDNGQARRLHRRVLDQKWHDQLSIEVCRAMNGLAILHNDAGEYLKSEELLKRAIYRHDAGRRRTDPFQATVLTNLGILYMNLGRYDEARPQFERADYIQTRVLRPDHPDVALRMHATAALLQATGKEAEAQRLAWEADRIRARQAERGNLAPDALDTPAEMQTRATRYGAAPSSTAAHAPSVTTTPPATPRISQNTRRPAPAAPSRPAKAAAATPAAVRRAPEPKQVARRPDGGATVEDQMTVSTSELYGCRFDGVDAQAGAAESEDPLTRSLPTVQSELSALRCACASDTPTPLDASIAAALPFVTDGLVTDALDSVYRIEPGDVLQFRSFNDETLSAEVTVRYDGYVSLPLIPDFYMQNKSREEALSGLRVAYASVFRDPQLSLVPTQTTSKYFSVMGDVSRPSRYPYTGPTTLLDAINVAGGMRERTSSTGGGAGFVSLLGQLTKAFIIRNVDGERQVFECDLQHLSTAGPHASQTEILPGDMVYVPEGVNLVYVLGEIRNPVIVELTEGLTLIQLLARSGGFNTSTAKLRRVVLLRQTGEDTTNVMHVDVRQMLKEGGDITLAPGDVVYIMRKNLVALEEFVRRFTGSISPLLSLYIQAHDGYYVRDLYRNEMRRAETNDQLRILGNLAEIGDITQTIADGTGAAK